MNCIIIDDDKLSCRLIEEYVHKTDGLVFVNSYSSPQNAIENNISFDHIDILFLDVEMPGMTGFDFLKSLENPPVVIIMSAKETYAVDAFTFSVTDFLLKPISYPRFLSACEKAEVSVHAKKVSIQKIYTDSLFLKKDNSHVKINYKDIYYIEAMENYAVFFTEKENYIVHQSMKYIENKLPKNIFRRIHRSYIANVTMVYKIDESLMILGNESKSKALPIGKNYKSAVLSTINSL
jgi:DNA-binding LytR/AlgR family response regulator